MAGEVTEAVAAGAIGTGSSAAASATQGAAGVLLSTLTDAPPPSGAAKDAQLGGDGARQQQQQQPGQGDTNKQQQPTASSPQPLWEHFVVVGLPPSGLCTVQGEQGFLGTSDGVRYKPALLDALPHTRSPGDERCQLPPQLPTVRALQGSVVDCQRASRLLKVPVPCFLCSASVLGRQPN